MPLAMVAASLKSLPKAVWVGIAVGLLVELLFPWSMLLTLIEGMIGPVSLSVGLVQFPAYGGLLGWSIARRNYSPARWMGAAHLTAAVICFTRIMPNFS